MIFNQAVKKVIKTSLTITPLLEKKGSALIAPRDLTSANEKSSYQVRRGNVRVFTERVEEHRDWHRQVAWMETARCANLRRKTCRGT